MHLKPFGERITVKKIEEGEQIIGGIIVPMTAKDKTQVGEVLAVGSGKRLDNGNTRPMLIKVGDIIAFGKYSGTALKIDSNEVLVLLEDEVIGILEK